MPLTCIHANVTYVNACVHACIHIHTLAPSRARRIRGASSRLEADQESEEEADGQLCGQKPSDDL